MVNTGQILSYARRAADDYKMIEEGDRIAVGVSAGKDSLTLLCAMAQLRIFYPKKFELLAITLDCGFDGVDFKGIQNLCEELNVEYKVVPTNIREVVFDIRKEKNPCALCSNLRHGMLNETAKELGYNKVALGHHMDDCVETFMLNLIYEGRIGTFSPTVYLDRKDLTLIRPLIYTSEKEIKSFANKQNLPVVTNTCPANGKTKRQYVKELLQEWGREHKDIKKRLFGAIQRAEIDGYADIIKLNKQKRENENEEN